MGGQTYDFTSRSIRTQTYASQSFADTFGQQSLGEMHNSMNPMEIKLRECRDSEVHPNSIPIIFGLDGTGSMDYIPKHMVVNGLPTLVSNLHQKGVPDAAILFMVLGDSQGRPMYKQWDKAPLQIGQFESGDKELDLWLTRSWIEGGGWGNGGESYAWAWWFAANRVVSDAWEKRKEKGFIFTVGDDKCLDIAPEEFKRVLNITHEFATKEDLYKAASERWNVYHFCLDRNQQACASWQKFMGENCIQVHNHEDIPNLIADIIAGVNKNETKTVLDPYLNKPERDGKITL